MNELDAWSRSARSCLRKAATPADLETPRRSFWARPAHDRADEGHGPAFRRGEERPAGAAINVAKQAIEGALNAPPGAAGCRTAGAAARPRRWTSLCRAASAAGWTAPGVATLERIQRHLRLHGFDVAEAPRSRPTGSISRPLNTPEDHPARSMHDTFYVEGGTPGANSAAHATPAQCRCAMRCSMSSATVPARRGPVHAEIRVIAGPHLPRGQRRHALADVPPVRGPVDRREREFRDLKVVFTAFCRTFFESEISCCASAPASSRSPSPAPKSTSSSRTGAQAAGWRWRLGPGASERGAQHGLDPERYIGFAFGMGLDR